MQFIDCKVPLNLVIVAPYYSVAIRNPEQHVHKTSHCGSEQQ